MTATEITERIRIDEHGGEKLISNVRLIMGFIFTVSTTGVAIARVMQGEEWIPWRAHIVTSLLLLYSIYIFVYVRKKDVLSDSFKYIVSIIDMTLISAIIWVACTYPHLSPPLPFLSFRALFYSILIAAGSCRYSPRCAYVSGYYAALAYLVVIVVNRNVLDLPHTVLLDGVAMDVSFPLYFESFRIFGIIITGIITGLASKRRLNLFNSMIESEAGLRDEMDETNKHHLAQSVKKNKKLNEVVVESFEAIENIRMHIEGVESKIQNQVQSIKGASSSAHDIFEQLDSFQKKVLMQADSIAQSTKAIEHMVSNLDSVRSIALETRETAETLMKSSDTGHKMLVNLTENMKQIEKQSAALIGANKIIAGIAGQTNILAMNAAIEAAHAGESGRGFAVVASEVRKLAELSTKESETISVAIKSMEKVIEQIGDVSQTTVESMEEIFSGVKDMSASFTEVDKAVEVHAAEGSQVVNILETVRRTSKEVQEGSGVIHEKGTVIYKEMNALEQISTEITQAVGQMKASEEHVEVFLEKAKEIVSLQKA